MNRTLVWYDYIAHILAGPGRLLCGRTTNRGLVYRKEQSLSPNTDIVVCGTCSKVAQEWEWEPFEGYECPRCGLDAVLIAENGHMVCTRCKWTTVH